MKKSLLLWLFMAMSVVQALAQTRTITGKVTDAAGGQPLPGVTVRIGAAGTITDISGNFKLNVPADAEALEVSFLGYVTQKVPVAGRNSLSIQLVSDQQQLNEYVVVAYGTARKGSYTGSVAQLDSRKIAQRPLANVTSALEGAAPGVQVDAGNGQPGTGPRIRIRGIGSVNSSNAPLYVVDGVPYSGDINNLNPDDIENISLLKDASAAALYGARAANGVVIVTTKKGRSGSNQVQVRVRQGWTSRAIPEYDRVTPQEYYPLMWEAYRNSMAYADRNPTPMDQANQIASGLVSGSKGIKDQLGYNPFNVADNDIVRPDGTLNPNAQLLYADDLDWAKEIARIGKRGDYNAAFSGGSEKTDYYISLGYLNEKGFVIKSDFERYTGRVNVNTNPLSWFRTGVNLSATVTKSNTANVTVNGGTGYVNPFFFARNIGPIYPVYAHNPQTGEYILDRNGNKIYDLGSMTELGLPTRAAGGFPGRHIVAETYYNNNLFKRNVLSGRTFAEVTFLKNFKFTTNISVDITNRDDAGYDNTIVGDGAPGGRADREHTTTTSYNLNQLLNFNKSFNKHNVEALIGHENYDMTSNYQYAMRQGQIVDGNTELINFTTTNDLYTLTDKHRIEGYFSRVNYNYDEKYFASVSYRRDGSSRFYQDVRWGDFWSVSGAWRLDNESFIKRHSWINMLKLRASYGETGNDALLDADNDDIYYAWQALYGLGFNNAYEPGFAQLSLASRDLMWETNTSSDIGLEFSLFKDRLTGTIEYFHRKSDNLLFRVPLPLSSGLEERNMNIGSMYNRGFEAQIGVDVLRNKDFNWNVELNVTTIKNEITKLPQREIIRSAQYQKLMVGHSIYDYWVRDWYGVDPQTGNALYVAADKDTVTTNQNNARYHYAGSAIPDFYGSIRNTFSYRNFELSFLLSYQVGGKVYDATYAALMHSGSYGAALHKDALTRWQKPGDVTNVPRMDNAKTNVYGASSDRFLTDASFLNIRSVQLGYTLPRKYASRLFLQNANIYVSGENLFLFTARKGMSPNQVATGVTSNVYVPARVITLGLNVTL